MDNSIPQQFQALKAVLAQGNAPLDQVGPGAPTAKPNMTAPSIPQGRGMPAPQPSGQMPSAQGMENPQAGLPQGSPEAQTIIKALSQRLSTISKLETGQGGV